MKNQTLNSLIKKIKLAGVPCGPILPVPESLTHPQVEARNLIIEQEHVVAGSVRNIGSPLGFESKSYATCAPPLCGEHSEAILSESLNFSRDEIEVFKSTGVLGA